MSKYTIIKSELYESPSTWLVTGAAGFIGSNIVEELLKLNQKVIGLDNLSTGSRENLEEIKAIVLEKHWNNFTFIEGDICDEVLCKDSIKGANYVLHQAALGSVPRSIKAPIDSTDSNVMGFLKVLNTAKDYGVNSFTFASSSSVYGDHPGLPKIEERTGNPLSTYALTKSINENYASVFALNYGFDSIGLRYFNVFGKRQNPSGEYAAVIPKWISAMIEGHKIKIYGDGKTSRDFCYVDNVVQMNILAALSTKGTKNRVYNVANGDNTTLESLYKIIKKCLQDNKITYSLEPEFSEFRDGDVKHSTADITKAKSSLGYQPEYNINKGLDETVKFYLGKEL